MACFSLKEFLEEIRLHGLIENNLHWILNQSLKENKLSIADLLMFMSNYFIL